MTPQPVVPEENYSERWADDTRPVLPQTGDERAMLTTYLEFHRATFASKCAGVEPAQMNTRTVSPSTLTLHGLLRHLTGVERWWFQINFAGDDVPMIYYSDDDPDQDFERLDGDLDEAWAAWRRECDRSREIVAATVSLDVEGHRVRDGAPISLRGVLIKHIAEYAQHNGHADLLREGIDGATGA